MMFPPAPNARSILRAAAVAQATLRGAAAGEARWPQSHSSESLRGKNFRLVSAKLAFTDREHEIRICDIEGPSYSVDGSEGGLRIHMICKNRIGIEPVDRIQE